MKRSEKEEQERRSILADLVTRASTTHPPAKRVLETYRIGATIIDNIDNLRKLEKEEVESASEFLGLSPRAPDNKKLYKNRNTLAHRVLLKLESLLPSKCGICVTAYNRQLNDTPLLTCWTCYRPSHDCPQLLENSAVIEEAKKIPGFKWLCPSCEDHTSLSLKKRLTQSNIDSQAQENTDVQPAETEDNNEEFLKEDVSNSTLYLSQIEDEVKEDTVHEDENVPQTTGDDERADRSKIECRFHKRGTCRHGAKGDKKVGDKVCPYLHKPTISAAGNTQVSAQEIYDECKAHTRYGRCKHGLSGKLKIDGKPCENKHPKICRRLRRGGYGKDGCNKGSKCEFVHPKLCRGSMSKDRACPDPANCKFFHVTGTRLTPKKEDKVPRSQTATVEQEPKKSFSDAVTNEGISSNAQDFCHALVNELKKGFVAQAHYLQQVVRSLVPAAHGYQTQPVPGTEHLPDIMDFTVPGMGVEQDRPNLPRGMGMTQGLYQPSQRFIF